MEEEKCERKKDCPHCAKKRQGTYNKIKEVVNKKPDILLFMGLFFEKDMVDATFVAGGNIRELSQLMVKIMEKDPEIAKIFQKAVSDYTFNFLLKIMEKEKLKDFPGFTSKGGEA